MQSIFADEVISMSLTPEGIVQIQLGVRAFGENSSEGYGVVQPILHLSLSLKGFLKAFEGQEKIMSKLMNDGIVKKNNTLNGAL